MFASSTLTHSVFASLFGGRGQYVLRHEAARTIVVVKSRMYFMLFFRIGKSNYNPNIVNKLINYERKDEKK